jgi:putative FmdB family regulatory protein
VPPRNSGHFTLFSLLGIFFRVPDIHHATHRGVIIMPTYEYECRACNHAFELFQAMSDEPVKVCPQCGGSVRRMIGGGTGIIFKGSGFYVTDSKKSSSAASSTRSPGAKPKKQEAATDTACAGCPAASPAGGCPSGDAGTSSEGKKASA